MINEKPLIIQSFNSDKYKTKEFKKKNIVPFLYFSKKQFKKYREDNNCMIMGDVKVNQRKYKDIITSDNPDKLIKKKNRKNITGTVKMLRSESIINKSGEFIEAYQSFDLFETREYRHCFDTSQLSGDLKTIGNLMVTDFLVNTVTKNFKNGLCTDLFFDEFQTMLVEHYTAEYFNSAWRRYRKRGAFPCGLTQNIEYLKSDVEFSTMLGNSSWVTMYELTSDDMNSAADMYGLSESQLEYVKAGSIPGNGLMRIGGNIVPFDGQFPKDNILYTLMTTKAGEWKD